MTCANIRCNNQAGPSGLCPIHQAYALAVLGRPRGTVHDRSAYNKAWNQKRRDELRARGLTSRGTPVIAP